MQKIDLQSLSLEVGEFVNRHETTATAFKPRLYCIAAASPTIKVRETFYGHARPLVDEVTTPLRSRSFARSQGQANQEQPKEQAKGNGKSCLISTQIFPIGGLKQNIRIFFQLIATIFIMKYLKKGHTKPDLQSIEPIDFTIFVTLKRKNEQRLCINSEQNYTKSITYMNIEFTFHLICDSLLLYWKKSE